MTESGLDNGAGGSVAGDGVLQPGEIQKTSFACVGGGSDPNGLVPPPGPPGTGVIRASGGAGLAGRGGAGCNVFIGPAIADRAGQNESTKVFKSGKFDATTTLPVETPTFGPRKLDVTADRSIPIRASSAEAMDGEYYAINWSGTGMGLYFRESAANPQVPVTGVHVAPGVTLTFPTGMDFELTNDFHNEGVVTTQVTGEGTRLGLVMRVAKYIGAPGSEVRQAGATATSGDGGNGGGLMVIADRIVNAGTIDTSGGNGDGDGSVSGGDAGSIFLFATRSSSSGPLVNTGTLKAVGGRGKGAGGNGANIILSTSTRGLTHMGDMDASGGTGGTIGGSSGSVGVNGAGDVRVSGTIAAKGGDVDEAVCAASCAGGGGGNISLATTGGSVVVDANLVATGGKGKGGPGGDGGGFAVLTRSGTEPVTRAPWPGGSVYFSGDVDVRGGQGSTGGTCGGVQFLIQDQAPIPRNVELRGIATIDTSGGTGTSGGGDAGAITMLASKRSVANHAALVAKGGDATAAGSGGTGGAVHLKSGSGLVDAPNTQALVMAGPIDASGGKGVSAGGQSGGFLIESGERIIIAAPVTASGGNATGAGGVGGASATSVFVTAGAFTSTAEISIQGGSGVGANARGGDCTVLRIPAGSVTSSSPISCKGGNGNGAAGGNGGTINVFGTRVPSQLASVSAAGGTGTPNGNAGTITIDNVVQP